MAHRLPRRTYRTRARGGGFRREVQPRRQHWFLNEKSGFPFRTPAFCSVSRGQRRLGEKEYRAPSVTPGVALRPRTQGRSLSSSDKSRRSITIRTGRLDAWLSHSTSSEVAFVYLLRMMVGYVFRSDQAAHRATVVPPAPGVCSNAIVADLDLCTTPVRLAHTPTRCRVVPVARIKLGIGRRLCVASDAEQRTEGVERVEAPVEPKREFVEVGL